MILESLGSPKSNDFGIVLGSKIDEKSVLGGLLGPRPILEVQKPSETLVLGGQVGAFLGLSRLLAASWSLKKRLEASRGGLEPLSFPRPSSKPISDLILDRFWTPKRPQNRQKINPKSMPTGSWKRRLISRPLASKIQEDLKLKLKRPTFENYGKTIYF